MTLPRTHYAQSGEVRIAYQVIGQGAVDLVFVPGFISNLEVHWEEPGFSHLLRRLSAFTRVIQFDKRGTGLSDRVDNHRLPGLETRMDDVRAVMDAAGSRRAALLGASEGGPMSILFAATYPERTRALVLYGAYANFHTWVLSRAALEDFIAGIDKLWGTGASVTRFAPEQGRDERFHGWWARYERQSCSPSAAIALARMNASIDVRSVLPTIRVPTLVIHRTEDARVKVGGGRYLAEKIPGARFVELPGRDHPVWTGNIDSVVDEIEEFLTGTRPMPAHNRVLATILVARLASPQGRPARLEDHRRSELLTSFQQKAITVIERHGGKPINVAGEQISARFDGPARAVRSALALIEAAETLPVEVAAGVHTGEIELEENHVAGISVQVAERLCARARVGEVLASGMVADLTAGSGLHFAERGSEAIQGLEAPLRMTAVAEGLEPARRQAAACGLTALSAREREVIALLAEGCSNAEIARRLVLSNHTVKRHVANILVKLDLPTRAAAAALVGSERQA